MTLDVTSIESQNNSAILDRSLMPPCQAACPLHMNIREYVDLVARGKVMEALQVIRSDNPFPSVCAYICSHPCEEACRRSHVDKQIAIRALKRFAVEFGGDRKVRTEARTIFTEKTAIIGSGPAGMSCAFYLRKLGYPVTVFEAHTEIGGMLRFGIPQYRLPREVLDSEIRRMTGMGIEFRTGTPVVSLDLLFEMGYQAIFVSIGAQQSRRLGVEGEDKPGVVDAITFLREINLGLKPAIGENVVVIGGGNVAIDASRSALRLGARTVNLVCLESRAEMPAFAADIQYAIEEGVIVNCSWGVKAILGKEVITGIELKRCVSVFDANGKFNPSFDDSITQILPADTVITAIGQIPQIPESYGLKTSRGTILVDPVTLNTNRKGVFAGGDAASGPATVIQALANGRLAAIRIDDYLHHRYPRSLENENKSPLGELSPQTIQAIRKISRYEPPLAPPEIRIKEFQPIEQVYNWETAVDEARRCLRCGSGAEILFPDKCATCLTCLRVCPYSVPRIDQDFNIQIPPDQCQACGICVTRCPAMAIALRKPWDRRHINEEIERFRHRIKITQSRPLIIGFCCQYGLFGTGKLAGILKTAGEGIWIIPIMCIAKVETYHLLQAFELGAEGVFVAGCGEQCARENTIAEAKAQIQKAQSVLVEIGLKIDQLQAFLPEAKNDNRSGDPEKWLEEFAGYIGSLHLNSLLAAEGKN